MKIVLLGYMTSGKSSIGKQLSKNLSMKFLDLDDYIVEKEKMPITEIFSSKGEIYFRLIENTYLKEVLAKEEDFILSLGGGTPCYANNMEAINEGKTKSVYLKATNQTLIDRLILKKSTRPIIANLSDDQIPEFVAKHLFERRFYYEQAKYSINVDDKTIKQVSEEIEMLLY